MKKFAFPALALLALLGLGHLGSASLPESENPISQGGRWLNGAANGIDWNNIETKRGVAIGHVTAGVPFADPIAVLNPAKTGPWTTAQQAEATVFTNPGRGDYYPEVELHLNTTISAHKIMGYEFDCGVLNHPPPGDGCVIVRWNGPLANATNSNNGYTVLSPFLSVHFTNGDVMHVLNTNATKNNLQLYRNGSLVVECTDHTFTAGSPGLGFNGSDATTINNYADEGLYNFSASNVSPRD